MIKITNKNGDVKKLQEVENTEWIGIGEGSRYKRKNGVVYVVFNEESVSTGWNIKFMFPEGFRPTTVGEIYGVLVENADPPLNCAMITVTSSGEFRLNGKINSHFIGNISYPVD